MSRKNRRTNFEQWSPENKQNTIEHDHSGSGHFATRQRANDFLRLMRTLPDPDPVLRKMGRGITALQELLSDSHLESVWSIRCSAASGGEWFISTKGNGRKEKEAAEVLFEELGNLDTTRIIEEMMDAVAYGYSPLEVIWTPDSGRWAIGDIVGKPPQWFEFDQDNALVFRTGVIGTEPLPPNRFLIAQHRPSYANPYGVKAFSKCFWPATFKKNGFRWWTVFVEKYGGAFMYGKYPNNAGEQFKAELLNALEKMIADAVAIAPADSEITIDSLANKGSVSSVHGEYIEASNKEMSKAILGQTLTTDIGSAGSYAAAQAHNLVRKDLAAADRRRITILFNRLSAVWTFYNYGEDVLPPRFEFVEDEDLQKDRAERDQKLYSVGFRPKKSYIEREYGIPKDDFEIQELSLKEQTFSEPHHSCGYSHIQEQEGLLEKLRFTLFASKREKQRAKDNRLMKEFRKFMIEEGQENIDRLIEHYADALGTVDNFDDAKKILCSFSHKKGIEKIAHVIDEIRFASQGIRGSHHG